MEIRQQCSAKRQTQIWNSHTSFQWKSGKLKYFVKRSIVRCSNQYLSEKELGHLRTVFTKINDFPAMTVDRIIKNEPQKENKDIGHEPNKVSKYS